MLILAIDTAGANGSIALCEQDDGFRVIGLVPLAGGTYSAQLMPQIAALLARHKLDKRAIDVFAAASGPGSFTGLRVGLSTVKALAEVMQKPIASVSLLEALAWSGAARKSHPSAPEPSETAGQVMSALDAMRGQVFVGEYVVRDNALPKLLREALLTFDEFATDAIANAKLPVFTPDESVALAAGARGREVQLTPRPQSDIIGRIGALKIAAGLVTSPEALDANYIRRSDAEIFSRPGS